MKKSLLALAVLGAFAASAQAQVTVGGLAIETIKQYKVSQGKAATARVVATETRLDDDFNSRFWITGTEDLGSGLAAIFKFENRVFLDNASTVGSGLTAGESWVGLRSNNLGTLTFGRHNFHYTSGFATEVTANGLTALPGPMYANFTILDQIGASAPNASRIPNSIKYMSPKFSGFGVVAGYSTSVSTNEGVNNCTFNYGNSALAGGNFLCTGATTNASYEKGGAAYLEGTYANGPIYVQASYWDATAEGRTGSDHEDTRLSGAYTFPFGLKVGLNYDVNQLSNAATGALTAKRTAFVLPVSYAFGPNTVMFTYAAAGDIKTATTTTTDSGAKMLTLAYDYKFSNRTHVAVAYNSLKNGVNGTYTPFLTSLAIGGSQLATGEASSVLAASIVHSF